MSRKVRNWLKGYASAGSVVKTEFPTFSIFLYGGGG